ncbi:FERM2 protein, partial [Columbina picui]|nr:FERM2 protein [Columbina picui]
LDVKKDWSDHALWWEKKKTWLLKTHWTLDKYGIQADAKLQFTPQHKLLRLQLPNMKYVKVKVNFSDRVFKAVSDICKTFKLRERDSFSWENKQHSVFQLWKKKKRLKKGTVFHPLASGLCLSWLGWEQGGLGSTLILVFLFHLLVGNIYSSPGLYSKTMTPTYDAHDGSPLSPTSAWFGDSALSEGNPGILAVSQPVTSPESLAKMYKPQALLDKAKINQGWLDSSRSLMEQEVKENEALLLRFKYYSFFDLNPKYDAIRINQLYEQSKWAILLEEIECTEEEMMMFAALQYHINKLSIMSSENHLNNSDKDVDEVDAALSDLEITLEGGKTATILGDITSIPELADYIKVFKFLPVPTKMPCLQFKEVPPRKLEMVKHIKTPLEKDANQRLEKPATTCSRRSLSKEIVAVKFAQSWAACARALGRGKPAKAEKAADAPSSGGKTMADSSYGMEVQNILSFLKMQHLNPDPQLIPEQINTDINPECLVSPRYLKKYKNKQITARILEAHQNVAQMSLIEAKMRFIQAWQSLPEFGITHFIARFQGGKKEELIGIAYNRLIRMDASTGDAVKTWRFSNMKQWNVNWEIKMVTVEFADDVRVSFICTEVDCKVVHEFIGGYIFLSTRAKDQNESLDEEMFYKLTSGWV